MLSGAGISTESGIPDYRGPTGTGKVRKPIRYQEFASNAQAQRRYWARSVVGWRTVEEAKPNRGHRAVARLEAAGYVGGVITQNVDGLHQAAGSTRVLELHGRLAVARCLECRLEEPRRELQSRLLAANPHFGPSSSDFAADGDADLPQELLDTFEVVACLRCQGMLKPDVVMFGENVPARRVERAWSMLERASALVAVGTSLAVYSGFRFVARAVSLGKPVAVVNMGPTRADDLASMRLSGKLGVVLPQLAHLLEARPGSSKAGQAAKKAAKSY